MKRKTRNDYEKRIARVVEAIENSPDAPHPLNELAALANFSPFHFHRVYRAMQGEAVADTVRRARMGSAAYALASTGLKITEIALEAGYESAPSFARAFKDLVSVTPSDFRRSEQNFADCVPGPPLVSSKEDNEMHVKIIEQAPFKALAMRHEGPIASIPETWRKLWRWAVDHKLADKELRGVGICSGDPERAGAMIYFAGLMADHRLSGDGDVEIVDVQGGSYASYRHLGPYANIAASFDRLYREWLPASGFEPDDRPCLEIYRNNPYETPANELITDLLIPLRHRN